MRIQFKKRLREAFPKETLNVLEVFSVLDVEQYPTDVLSQEFLYMGMMKLKEEITFKLEAKG